MQSVPGALSAHNDHTYFANPSVGWANFPPEKAAGSSASGSIKRLPALKSNADWMSKNSAARVQIEGHCDDRGSEEYNIALGAKRAQAAKDYLETLGITADRMSTISYGKELPICTEDTDECWAQNRRDHFVVQE